MIELNHATFGSKNVLKMFFFEFCGSREKKSKDEGPKIYTRKGENTNGKIYKSGRPGTFTQQVVVFSSALVERKGL